MELHYDLSLTRIADPGMYQRTSNYDTFFNEHSHPSLQEIDDFLAAAFGYRMTEEHDFENRLMPTSAAAAAPNNPIEQYFVRTAILARNAQRSARQGFQAPATDEARLLIDYEEAQDRKLSVFVAIGIGIKRAAALIETEDRLHKMVLEHPDGGFALLKEVWQENRDGIQQEINERAEQLTEDEAKTLLAKAFGLDFEQYNEIFYEQPS